LNKPTPITTVRSRAQDKVHKGKYAPRRVDLPQAKFEKMPCGIGLLAEALIRSTIAPHPEHLAPDDLAIDSTDCAVADRRRIEHVSVC
jgi:hypothetical protein